MSQISQGGEGGITITSIKHSTDNFVPSTSTTGSSNRNSQISQKNESYSYNNTQETTVTTRGVAEQPNDSTPRWVDELRSVILYIMYPHKIFLTWVIQRQPRRLRTTYVDEINKRQSGVNACLGISCNRSIWGQLFKINDVNS